MDYDIAVIGAGIVGSLIARELSRYRLDICVVEKEADVAMGASKANSAIIHAGYDPEPGSMKAALNVRGNAMYDRLANELEVPFKRIGSLVLAFTEEDMFTLKTLYDRGLKNRVPMLEIVAKDRARSMEPNVSGDIIGALYAPTAGIVCPYELTLGSVENAMGNGVDLKLESPVAGIEYAGGVFTLHTPEQKISSRYVINAAGLYADAVANLIGDTSFSIRPRKGEYLLLDKTQGNLVGRTVFQTPTAMGKGVLVTPTVDGNLLLGPTAEDVESKEDISTTRPGLTGIIKGALKSCPGINLQEVISSFAGLRAVPSTGDFIIGPSKANGRFINVAGIESPGLTAAPAIAEYVKGILRDTGVGLLPKADFNPHRKAICRFHSIGDADRKKAIMRDPRYGRIVCRCEEVTEGEIVSSIKRPAGARDTDAVKRRTRAGMGRCQGGFCLPHVIRILSEELDIPMDKITKSGGNSVILGEKTK